MQVELFCPQCCCRFAAEPETPAGEVLDRMASEGPWYALGDGETFEDMIFSTLFAVGDIRCADCAQDRVGQRVQPDIGIRVPDERSRVRHLHAAEPDMISGSETMRIEPGSGADIE